jgi:predicted ester cyclase
MSEENKAVVRRYFEEIWSKGNFGVADEIVGAPGVTAAEPPRMSPERIKQVVSMMRQAFPDIKYTVQEIVAEGDKMMVYWTAQGTHQGEFRGIAPTGKQINHRGFDIYRMEGGRIVERPGGFNDDLGLFTQLGAVTPPGQQPAR